MTGKVGEIKLSLRTNIIQEYGALDLLSEQLDVYEISSPGILVDRNLYNASKYVSGRVDSLAKKRSAHVVQYEHPFEPSYQYLDKLINNNELFGHKSNIDFMHVSTLDIYNNLNIK